MQAKMTTAVPFGRKIDSLKTCAVNVLCRHYSMTDNRRAQEQTVHRHAGGRSRFPFPKLLAPRRSRSGQLGLPPRQGSPGVACHGLHGWKHWAHHLNCIESSGHCDRLGPFPGSLLREQARGFPQEPSGIFLRGIEVLAGLSQRLRAVGALRQRPPRRNP